MTKTSLATSTTATDNPAKQLTDAITSMAHSIGMKDKDRVEGTARAIFQAAQEERIPLQHVAQAVRDYALGRVEGHDGQFFPAPGPLMKQARQIWREVKADATSEHDKPVQYPPGIQKRIDAIQKLLKSDDYRLAKYEHLMRLKTGGVINYDPSQQV